ncbi:putative all-trans-nonaprenyl-diphosphate synthase (geranylgeranyl-diphosphate specific) [Helianthus anomalus]
MQAKKLSINYTAIVAFLVGDFMFPQSSWYLANLESLEVIKLSRTVYYCIVLFYFRIGVINGSCLGVGRLSPIMIPTRT